MKDRKAQELIETIRQTLEKIVADHGAPLRALIAQGSLSARERAAGAVARLYVGLADDAPGWRSKDVRDGRRTALKRAIQAALVEAGLGRWDVRIQASYSCLVQGADGSIVRRDDSGRTIGVHFS
jgi:hypothetical protein